MALATLTPQQLLATAILRVSDPVNGFAPYFGVALRGLIRRQMSPEVEAHLATRGSATLAVSADAVLHWSANYVATRTVDELAYDLMHETMHVLLKHADRGKAIGVATSEQHQLANLAADACINEELRKSWKDWDKKATAVYPETLEQPLGLIFEERYRLLQEKQKQKNKSEKDEKNSKSGKGSGGVTKGQCGGCAGEPLPGEGSGEGRSEAQIERVRRETAEAVQAHAAAKGRGTVPGGLLVWADEVLGPPKVDWRAKLGQLVRNAVAYKAGMVDLSWGRPSRRQAGLGFGVGRAMLPAYRAPVPRVGVLLDTSGSMTPKALAAAMSEVQGVIQTVGGSVTFAVVDAALHGIQDVPNIEQAIGMLKGGGGTDLTEGFEALRERHIDVIVACTDGYIGGGYPDDMGGTKVIWCIIDGDKRFAPRYGEVVVLDDLGQAA